MPKTENRAARRAELQTKTADGFQNIVSHLGLTGTNALSYGTYSRARGMLTKQRQELSGMYEGSWVAGTIIDCVADDMTRAGITLLNAPGKAEAIETVFRKTGLWAAVNEGLKWARLYGGAAVVIIVKGQAMETPLDPATLAQGSLVGFRVYTRHDLTPIAGRYIRDGLDIGLPEAYRMTITQQEIHHSRIVRFVGQRLPPEDAANENGWGHSVLERMQDRILAFDTVTMSAANLIKRAQNRVMSIEDFRIIMAQGGAAETALTKGLQLMKTFQDNEGLSIIDSKDKYEAHTYSFGGLSDLMTQFGAQLAGASGIPMVRWFGQSPSGMNATGESDFRNYYDTINQRQETDLRPGLSRLLELAHWSATGAAPPPTMDFLFTVLWQMSAEQKANIGKVVSDSLVALVNADVLQPAQALRELSAMSDTTGLGATITDEEIREAEAEPPMPDVENLPDPNAEVSDNPATPTADRGWWRNLTRGRA